MDKEVRRLERFLVIGVEDGSTYQASDIRPDSVTDGLSCVNAIIKSGHGTKVVDTLFSFSDEGRAPRDDYIIFVLALCARQPNDDRTKSAAYGILSKICRSSPQFLQFIYYCEELSKRCFKGSGWGRAHRNGVNAWYLRFKDKPLDLAMQVTKYPSRHNFSHQDVIRLSHVKTNSLSLNVVLRFVARGIAEAGKLFAQSRNQDRQAGDVLDYLRAVDYTRSMDSGRVDIDIAVEYIKRHNLVREHLAPVLLKSRDVWQALLPNMPLRAMVMNLATMTRVGIFSSTENLQHIKRSLTNEEAMTNARMHPFDILKAWDVYKSGNGRQSDKTWTPNPEVINALDTAYYKSFRWFRSPPVPHRTLCLALDATNIIDAPLNPSDDSDNHVTGIMAAAHMFVAIARTEPNHQFLVIANDDVKLIVIPKEATLDAAMKILTTSDQPHRSSTTTADLSLPIKWANKNKRLFDGFVLFTSDTNTNSTPTTSPEEALVEYRRTINRPDTKLISVALSHQSCLRVARHGDPHMLDIPGFDSHTPALIQQFMVGSY